MSVLIKGIDKPINCQTCPCSDEDCRFCKTAKQYIPMLGKPKFCPMVVVIDGQEEWLDGMNVLYGEEIDEVTEEAERICGNCKHGHGDGLQSYVYCKGKNAMVWEYNKGCERWENDENKR